MRVLREVARVDLHDHLGVDVVLRQDLFRVEEVDVGGLGVLYLPLVGQPEEPVVKVPLRHDVRVGSP